ncbi:MAG: hypothetical protein MJE68_12925 [Proteobacteria bacterium]|nr:hypothetical protein [Pseudomonadota bacterium]
MKTALLAQIDYVYRVFEVIWSFTFQRKCQERLPVSKSLGAVISKLGFLTLVLKWSSFRKSTEAKEVE